MIDYKKVELPGGSIVEITAPGLTYVDVVPSGELSVEKGVPSCVGVDVMHEGTLLKSVLQLLSAEVTVEEVELETEVKVKVVGKVADKTKIGQWSRTG